MCQFIGAACLDDAGSCQRIVMGIAFSPFFSVRERKLCMFRMRLSKELNRPPIRCVISPILTIYRNTYFGVARIRPPNGRMAWLLLHGTVIWISAIPCCCRDRSVPKLPELHHQSEFFESHHQGHLAVWQVGRL